ncbi:MAG: LysR family transcriptional regulator [Pirellulaceae bacterium]
MELQQLRYFVAVAETGSFSRAAERCCVAQPSLSQQVKKLETELGCKLFDRLPRQVVMTESGTALLPRAVRILDDVESAVSDLATEVATGRGPLVVGVIPTMAPYLMPQLLKKFVKDFPECQLTIREDFTEHLLPALVHHELDLAILSTPINDPHLEVEVIGQEELLLVVRKDYPLHSRSKRQLAVSDLREQPAIVLHEMHCLGQQIDSFCTTNQVSRRIVCQSTQLNTVLRLVDIGLGVSLVPEMCARFDQSRARRYERFRKPPPTREIAVAWRRDRTLSHLSEQFVAQLRHEWDAGEYRYEK